MFRNKIFLLLLLTPLALCALPSDLKTQMQITADASQYNYKRGETQFDGHVIIDQGTTHLIADRVITKRNTQNKIREATAYGLEQLAYYWTQPQKGEDVLHAHAKIMRLYPLESRIVLEGDVLVTQGENHFQGQVMVYNIKKQIVTVPAAKNSRATFIINSEQMKKA